MKLKLVLHTPFRHALVDGIPAAPAPFETFLSGRDSTAPAEPGLLEALRRYRDAPAGADDMIGFDNPAIPLFLDPFSTHADDASSAALETLRQAASNVWKAFAIGVDPGQAAAYRTARAGMDDASRARLCIWLRSADIVVTPIVRDKSGPARRAGVFEMLPLVRQRARDLDIFAARHLEELEPLDAWPAFPNFIMRTTLFHRFADGLFRLLLDLQTADADLTRTRGLSIVEFVLGLFLRALRVNQPLLRVRQVPVLQLKRTHPTGAMLNDFDAAFYAAVYPDVIAAGQDPLAHFIHHGFREHRDWMPCD